MPITGIGAKKNLEKRHKQKPAWQNTHEEIWMGGRIRAQESESQSNFFAPRRSAQADYLPKDIKTKNSGCHILTLTAATLLGWPLRVLGSSLRMPGRPGVGMPDQRFPGVLIREILIRFIFRDLMR